jgi:hypothetical protein
MKVDHSVVILENMLEEISGKGAAIGAGVGAVGFGGAMAVKELINNYKATKKLREQKKDCEDDDCRRWVDDKIKRQKKEFAKWWKKAVAAGVVGAGVGATVGSGSLDAGYNWVRALVNGNVNLPKMLKLPQHVGFIK